MTGEGVRSEQLSSRGGRVLAWVALFILVGTYICLPVADPDLWWHITVGRWIIAHGEIPHVDHWNLFAAGMPWRAYSWTIEIVFALVDRFFGDLGLLWLQLVLAVALGFVLQWSMSRMSRDRIFGAFAGAYATAACFNHFTLRPQVFVWIYFALLLVAVDGIAKEGLSKRRLAMVGLLGCCWANTHLTAALGLVGAFMWCLGPSLSPKGIRASCLTGMAFLLGTLITPYIGGEWLTFFAKSGHPLKFHAIAEFQPATILQYSTGFVVVVLVLNVVVAFSTRVIPTPGRALLAGALILAGLTAVKFLPFAAITLVALLASDWQKIGSAARDGGQSGIIEGLERARMFVLSLSPRTWNAIVFVQMALITVNVSQLVRTPIDTSFVPKDVVDFIERNQLPHPILNEFGAGGYLMYRFSNSAGELTDRVAIDGRTNVNPPEVWEMYQASLLGRSNWHAFIDAVKPRTIIWRQGSALVPLLFLSHEWCRVFATGSRDSDYVVFLNRTDFSRNFSHLSSMNCSSNESKSGDQAGSVADQKVLE